MLISLFVTYRFLFLAACSTTQKRSNLLVILGPSLEAEQQTGVLIPDTVQKEDGLNNHLCQPDHCFAEQNSFLDGILEVVLRGVVFRTDVKGLEKMCRAQDMTKQCVASQTVDCGIRWFLMSKQVKQYGEMYSYLCSLEGKIVYASLDRTQCNFGIDIDLKISTCISDVVDRINVELLDNFSKEIIMTDGLLCPYLTEERDCLRVAYAKACGDGFASLIVRLNQITNEEDYMEEDMEYGCLRD